MGDPNESGIIGPGQTVPETLSGPFILLSLQPLVDPARDGSPTRSWLILTTKRVANSWICANDFKGPLYLGKDDKLFGRADYTHGGVVYSGTRLKK
jgi:hypothetical protein